MCGIAGIWGQESTPLIRSMLDRLAHRGPDGEGMRRSENRGLLAHRRLAIMDPRCGQQPFANEDGSRLLVANGEIYNWRLIREAIGGRHEFRTRSDNEVALHLFEEADTDLAHHLDGMFALAIASGNRLYLARDPIGIKPLYFGWRADGDSDLLLFASEMKALDGLVRTMEALPPGTYYDSNTGIRRYYAVPDHRPNGDSPGSTLRQVRRAVETAVIKRLMSDVPLGAFLSGGLDSSIIAAVARRELGALHTFAVGVEGASDLEAARRVARHIDSKHHEYVFTARDVERELTRIIYHLESFDQDLVRSAVPCFFCSDMASDHVKVVLTGEGADELFGGYSYYEDIENPAALHQELRRSVNGLHNVNLQRVDRMTMAHGIEGRVPFLDVEMIDLGLKIPSSLKISSTASGEVVSKVILRQAFEDLLPAEIVWRGKEQFDQGSGSSSMLPGLVESLAGDLDANAYRAANPDTYLRSKEECYYHKLFMKAFECPQTLLSNVGRWSDRPSHAAGTAGGSGQTGEPAPN